MLGVCYDRALLLARLDVLQTLDLIGVPASTLKNAIAAIAETRFDLLVICGRVPFEDRVRITEEFRRRQRAKESCRALPHNPEFARWIRTQRRALPPGPWARLPRGA